MTLWHPASDISSLALSKNTLTWLLAPGSMTKRLNAVNQRPLQVRCLQQALQTLLPSETSRLALPENARIMLREVELLCHREIWIYARSAIPSQTLTGKYSQLENLGEQPLGEFLFSDPLTTRSDFEIAVLTPHDQEYQLAVRHLPEPLAPDTTLLARRSVFSLNQNPLLLTEVFLPICTQQLTHDATR